MNESDDKSTLLAICGATASGKSSLAEYLADRIGQRCVLIVTDSRKVYRGLEIGVAKPSVERRQRYRYEMLDLVDIDQEFNAFHFAQLAKDIVRECLQRNDVPIFVGGTGFYLEALVSGIFESPPIPGEIRQEILARSNAEGWDWAYEELAQCDPATAGQIHRNDQTRILRALETYRATGATIGDWQKNEPAEPAPFQIHGLALDWPRETLYQCINDRAERMMAEGMLEETESLLHSGYAANSPGLRTLGYAETIFYLTGQLTRHQCIEAIQRNTRRYAKRQLTWFRHRNYVSWVDPAESKRKAWELVSRLYRL